MTPSLINGRGAAAVIAAGGKASRMNGTDKLFADLGGMPVIIRALRAFQEAESITEIIIAIKPESDARIRALCEEYGISKLKDVAKSGEHRRDSILNAVELISSGIDVVAVHDGARPFITPRKINEIIALAREKAAVIPAVRVKDTIKSVGDGRIITTPDRSGLYAAQTPQAFLLQKYREAVKIAENTAGGASPPTDDASLFERAGFEVYITEGDYYNIKITTPEDMEAARAYLAPTPEIRIGTGYDVHKFAENRKLILGGVLIPHEQGLLGHSDADVAVHALMDALLGALALGDIGRHFPDNSDEFKGISSLELLRRVIELIEEKGYAISNTDITIITEKPKLEPYISDMRKNISEACKIPLEAVSVKATTEEGLGLSGRGIGAQAVCLVKYKYFT